MAPVVQVPMPCGDGAGRVVGVRSTPAGCRVWMRLAGATATRVAIGSPPARARGSMAKRVTRRAGRTFDIRSAALTAACGCRGLLGLGALSKRRPDQRVDK